MAYPTSGSGSVLASLRQVSRSLLGLAQNRIELFGVELQEEKLRAINLLVWMSAAIALGAAGLLVLVEALALFLWQTTGFLGLVILGATVVVVAATMVWLVHTRLRRATPPFAETINELKKDAACLQPKD